MSLTSDKDWQVDKRIPVALIITLIMQTAGVGFWIGQTQQRVNQLERSVLIIEDTRERVIRMEAAIEQLIMGTRN